MDQATQFTTIILAEVRRRIFEESIPRIKKCLGWLTEEEVWQRPNEQSNSVGNLVLHLCGNATQWIASGLGGRQDFRRRQEEFDARGPLAKAVLLEKLHQLQRTLEEVLEELEPSNLLDTYTVQGFQETGVGILIHVVEHFSYHTGQITYYVKAKKAIDTGYYSGMDLDKTSG